MTPERWRQLDAIFAAALELAPEERPAFLDRVCRDDAKMRRTVADLLDIDSREPGFLERPACGGAVRRLAVRLEGTAPSAPQKPEPALSAGEMIDHFRIMRTLGRGGMGEVYLARDTRLGRRVALKVLRSGRTGTPQAVASLMEEARITASFNHPHIVTVHAVGEHRGRPYLAMEHLEGEDLRRRARHSTFTAGEVVRYGRAIAEALAEAHRHGVLHRDLKPANVLIARDGRLRVLDFGLATVVAATQPYPATAPGPADARPKVRRGTPAYMAPELWQGGACSAESDVWALGMIMYELAEGRHPWAELAQHEISLRARDSSLQVPPTARCRRDNEELARLIDRCLDNRPEQRPAAAEMVEKLTRLPASDQGSAPRERSPFKGLLPWSGADASWFCGREAEVDGLVERLRGESVLIIAGPSGAGKSSLVQAGVVPRLREQGRWLVIRLRPGRNPLRALAAAVVWAEHHHELAITGGSELPLESLGESGIDQSLVQAEKILAGRLQQAPTRLALRLTQLADDAGARVLLCVDQLEELFTHRADEQSRSCFLEAVLTCADVPDGPVRSLLCVREDYLGRLHAAWPKEEEVARIFVLGVPSSDALREILLRPVEAAGYRWDDEQLVDEMVSSVRTEVAALSLLQFAGLAVWERRDRSRCELLRSAYHELGGVLGALARHADSVLGSMSAVQVEIARSIFLRLVTPDGARQAVPRSVLLEGLGHQAAAVLDRFIDERTIVVRRTRRPAGEETELELVHEALVRVWPQLRQWLEEGREEAAFLAEAGQAAELWDRRGRRSGELWRGEALREALSGLRRYDAIAPPLVSDFIAAGNERERQGQRRRWRVAAFGFVGMVVISLLLGLLSVQTRRQWARAELQRARVQLEGARAAYARDDPLEARAKLRASLETTDSLPARILWQHLQQQPLYWTRSLDSAVFAVAFSADGTTVAAVSNEVVRLFDLHSGNGRTLHCWSDKNERLNLWTKAEFTPDGQYLVLINFEDCRVVSWKVADGSVAAVVEPGCQTCTVSRSGVMARSAPEHSIQLLDALTGEEIGSIRGHDAPLRGLWFHPDGQLLASTSEDQSLRLWDVPTGNQLLAIPWPHQRTPAAIRFAPDKPLMAWDEPGHHLSVREWPSGVEVGRMSGSVGTEIFDFAFGPGGMIASAGSDHVARLWTPEGQLIGTFHGHTHHLFDLCFHPAGHLLATASADGTIRLWSTLQGTLRQVLSSSGEGVSRIAFSPDGRFLVAGGLHHSVRVWDLEAETSEPKPNPHTAAVYSLDFSPDGSLIASCSRDGTIRFWGVATGSVELVLRGHQGPVFAVAFSPRGDRLVSAGTDRTLRRWDLSKDQEVMRILGTHEEIIYDLVYSPDGNTVASSGRDGTSIIFDVATGERLQVVPHAAKYLPVVSAVFSPDGRRLATQMPAGAVSEWSTATGALLGTSPPFPSAIGAIAYGPAARWIVAAGQRGEIYQWQIGSPDVQVLAELGVRLNWIDVHAAGPLLGVPLADGSAWISNLTSGHTVRLDGHRSEVNRVRFSPDGYLAATASDDETVRLWNTRTGAAVWRTRALLRSPPVLLSHRGWQRLGRTEGVGARVVGYLRQALEARAFQASQSQDGEEVCLVTESGRLERWDARADRCLATAEVGAVKQVLATGYGCLVRSSDGSTYSVFRSPPTRTGQVDLIRTNVSAMGLDRQRLVLAADGKIWECDPVTGEQQLLRRARIGITAIAPLGNDLAIGYRDGMVELTDGNPAATGKAQAVLKETPQSEATCLVPGPRGTLAAGFADGRLGLWDRQTGAVLATWRVHGPVQEIVLGAEELFAVSELGDVKEVSLAALQADRCDLLRQVWRHVPVMWVDGKPEYRSPPDGHQCSDSGGQDSGSPLPE